MTEPSEPRYPLHTLTKAAEILSYIRENAGASGVTLQTLSRSLGISKSSVHRILDTLLYLGFVDKSVGPIVRYKLGWGLYHTGLAVPSMHPFIQDCYETQVLNFSAETGHQVSIFTEKDSYAVPVYEADCGNRVSSGSIFTLKLPLYASAPGKLFMLNYDDEEIRTYFHDTEIRRYTSHTILNYIEFIEELGTVSANGYAEDSGEYQAGVCNLACPIRNHTGKITAAVSISFRSLPPEDEKQSILQKLKALCSGLSAYLGYPITT